MLDESFPMFSNDFHNVSDGFGRLHKNFSIQIKWLSLFEKYTIT